MLLCVSHLCTVGLYCVINNKFYSNAQLCTMYPKKVKLQIEFSNHQDCLRSLRRPDGNFLNSEKQLCMARFKDNRFVITSLNCTIQCSPSAATTLYIASGDARI